MEKIILKYRRNIIGVLAFGMVVALVILPLFPTVLGQETEDETITVTGTIQAWLNFAVEETAFILDPDLVESDGATNIGTFSSTFDVGTNHVDGWYIQIEGTNDGLLHTDPEEGHTIDAVDPEAGTLPAILSAGSDGYGLTVEADGGFSGTLSVESDWVEAANAAGPVASSPVTIASSQAPHGDETVGSFIIRAAAESTTPSGDYTDTITVTATAGLE